MKHLGDICKINGAEIAPVDVIIGGSPCQDLSVAGNRKGMKHDELGDDEATRSGLFMEQLRIIKEMRDATRKSSEKHGANQPVRPRFMVWENVPGAFSSNKAEDFRIVLEETARIADGNAVIPRPPKNKWANAGTILGNGFSIAWRVLDAQFWGVPQRRRRIALVADFGGQSAPEILFERQSVSGDFAESGAQGEGVAGGVEGCAGEAGTDYLTGWDNQEKRVFTDKGVSPTLSGSDGGGGRTVCGYVMPSEPVTYPGVGITSKQNASKGTPGVCHTLSQDERNYVVSDRPAVFSFDSLSSNSMKSSNPHSGCRQVEIAKCIDTTNPDPSKNQGGMAVIAFTQNQREEVRDLGDKAGSIAAESGMHQQTYVAEVYDARGNGDGAIATYSFQRTDELKESSVASTQSARQYKSPTDLVAAVDCRNFNETGETFGTLQAKPNGGQSLNYSGAVRSAQSVRRLTPLEAERLQGYEDNWTNIPPQTEVTAEDLSFWREVWDEWQTMEGKKPKTDKQIIKWLQSEAADSARYKALGNSIALPPWRFVLSRIYAQGVRTMGSLFDGIGGFPLIWKELGGKTLWASEIEPFCIAVTMHHFKEVHNGK